MDDQYFLFLVDEMDFAYEATDTETAEALLKSEEVFYHCHFDPLKKDMVEEFAHIVMGYYEYEIISKNLYDAIEIATQKLRQEEEIKRNNETMNQLMICKGDQENLMTLRYNGMLYELDSKEFDIDDDNWYTKKNTKGLFDVNIYMPEDDEIFCSVYQINIDDDGWCVTDASKWETIEIVRKRGPDKS